MENMEKGNHILTNCTIDSATVKDLLGRILRRPRRTRSPGLKRRVNGAVRSARRQLAILAGR